MTQQTYTPDWSKAPTDANWHARDSDGCGFWYNKRPAPSRGFWSVGRSLTIADNDCPVLDHDSELDNWRDTLTVRPFQERDIPQNLSDYFTGKTPFIIAYVDLLLARMAKEDRFGLATKSIEDAKVFDIYTIKQEAIMSNTRLVRYFIVLDVTKIGDDWGFRGLSITQDGKHYWSHLWDTDVNGEYIEYCRPITEFEAVEFRKAMEAVYG